MAKVIIAPKNVKRLGWIQVGVENTMLNLLVNGDDPYRRNLADITIAEMENSQTQSTESPKPASTVA